MNTEANKRARKKWREANADKERESKRQYKLRNKEKVLKAELLRQQRPGPKAVRKAYMDKYNKELWAKFVALPEDFQQTIKLLRTVKQRINGLKRTEVDTIQSTQGVE